MEDSSSGFDYRNLLPLRNTDSPFARGTYNEGVSSDADGDDDDLCSFLPEMNWRERLLGCATCMIAGYLLSFGSFWRIKDLILGDPLPFVLNATVGNIIALAGSCFLSGPKSQYQKMWHESRKGATILYLGSLALTLLVAFSNWMVLRGLILIILMIFQYFAIAWYCLSYIPFAREAVTSYFQRRFQFRDTPMMSSQL